MNNSLYRFTKPAAAILVAGGMGLSCRPVLEEPTASPSLAGESRSAEAAVQRLVARAQEAANRQDLAGAAAFLDAALMLEPAQATVRKDLVRVLLRAGRGAEGEAVARVGLESEPVGVDWRILLGACQADQGQAAAAIRTWLEGLDQDPSNAELRRLLGEIYLRQGLVADAIGIYQKALEADPEDAQAALRLGIAHEAARQDDEAIALYQQALRIDPQQVEAAIRLGTIFLRRQQADPSLAVYRFALTHQPDSGELWQKLGITLSSMGRLDESLLAVIKALQLENRNGAYWRTLLGLLHRHLVSDEEEQKAEPPPDWAAPAAWHHHRALEFARADNTPQAVHHFVQALWIDLDQPQIHNDLGVTLVGADQLVWAVPFFEAALLLDPNAEGVRQNLQLCQAALAEKRRQVELAAAEEALRQQPDAPAVQYRMGLALAATGAWSHAVPYFATACRTDTSNMTYRASLSRALSELGRVEEAASAYETVLEAYPDQPPVQHFMAQLLLRQPEPTTEQRALALALAQQAADASATNRVPRYLQTLAAAHAALEEWSEAADVAAAALAAAEQQGSSELAQQLASQLQTYHKAR